MAKSKTRTQEWIDWIKAIMIVCIVAFLAHTFIATSSIVEGDSMYPTLEDGERIFLNKFIYMVSTPNRGDIIIFERPEKKYVKRIIGLPNETIEMKDHKLYVNDVEQDISYVDGFETKLTGDFGPVTIPDDHYFVLGDNRAISKDSRNGLGFVSKSDIIGKTEIVMYPIPDWKRIK
ncbi:MAG TPA: signal peptidase I [Pseudogracilibacillus sp.]|nr:signal peptidase I [Pseudogracilibacillus sp.]